MGLRLNFLLLLGVCIFSGCKEDPLIVPDNEAPYYDEVPTVLIENYVNRLFIDLIGREPVDAEMAAETAALRQTNLSEDSREALILKLQTSNSFVPGDTSYARAYFYWLYESAKARTVEGASELEIGEFLGQAVGDSSRAAAAGDMDALAEAIARITSLRALLAGKGFTPGQTIYIDTIFRLMIDNDVYDFINMNSFNFVNATFDNLFYRFPSVDEFDRSYDMVEFSNPNSLWGMTGTSKKDYMDIIIRSREFYEGVVRWVHLSALAREPSSLELTYHMSSFYSDKDYQKLQREIMKTDEYANLD